MKSLNDTFNETKGWIMLGAAGLVIWNLRGVFSAAGNTATQALESATENIRANATLSSDKAKVKVQAPGATPSQIEQYKSDAAAIAASFRTSTSTGYLSSLLPVSGDVAFGIIKRTYSRCLLSNNRPYDKTTLKGQANETASSAKRKVNWHVLEGFYRDETGGRSLQADLKKYLDWDKYQPTIKWIL